MRYSNVLSLDKGINFFVKHPNIQNAFTQLDLTHYPEQEMTELVMQLAEVNSVAPTMIMFGNGVADLIDLLCKVYLNSGGETIILDTTYGYYETAIKKHNAVMRKAATSHDGAFILEATKKQLNKDTRIIFIDSPSNPLGHIISIGSLKNLLSYTNAYVVVDEEYIEYGGKSVVSLLKHYPNLVILRSFSKWAGLAGARVGYMLAHSEVIDTLKAAQPPHAVNTLSLRAAMYALQHRTSLLASLDELETVRQYIITQLTAIGYVSVSHIVPYVVIWGSAEAMTLLRIAFLDNGYQMKLLTIKNSHAIRFTIPTMSIARDVIRIAAKVYNYELHTKVPTY